MATISGGTGEAVTLDAGSNDQNGLAAILAGQISAALAGGALVPTNNTNPPNGTGFYVSPAVNATIVLQSKVSALALTGGGADTVFGSGGQYQAILAGSGNLTLQTRGGTGSVVTGDGNNLFATPTTGGGGFSFVTGSGNDTVIAATGDNTISAGAGHNLLFTSGSNDVIYSNGDDTVVGGAGPGLTDTVFGGAGSTFIGAGAKNLNFVGGSGPVTVLAGSGSETVVAGLGGGLIAGGTAGNNVLTGGNGPVGTTMFGGGDGDLLSARGSGTSILVAGAGNETLTGAGSTGSNAFFTTSGNASIQGGPGNDVIFADSGNATVDGGTGADLIAIVNGRAGGNLLLSNFSSTEGDKVTLQGYSAEDVADAIRQAGSSGTITLTDNTKITFGSLSSVASNNFI